MAMKPFTIGPRPVLFCKIGETMSDDDSGLCDSFRSKNKCVGWFYYDARSSSSVCVVL